MTSCAVCCLERKYRRTTEGYCCWASRATDGQRESKGGHLSCSQPASSQCGPDVIRRHTMYTTWAYLFYRR